jgi:hypothetical protein
MTKALFFYVDLGPLEFIWYWACLREAASA